MFFTRLYEDKQLQKYWNCSTLLLLFRENGCLAGIRVISGPAHHWPVETLGWCCEEVYMFCTLSENFGCSLESFSFYEPATKSNNDCHLESSDYEIADKNHLHYFRPDVNCSYLSSFRIKIQCARHHPDGHVAKAWSFHTLSTEETPETEFLRIHELSCQKSLHLGQALETSL